MGMFVGTVTFFPFVEVLPVVEFVLEEGIRYMYISRLGTFVALHFEVMFAWLG